MTQTIRLIEDNSRAEPVARALAALPLSIYEAVDRGEPEWPVLERLAGLRSIGLLTAIAVGLSDYQLGIGGAAQYWREAASLLDQIDPKATNDVRDSMVLLMGRPVASRLRDVKLARTERFLASKVPRFLETRTVEELGRQPRILWHELASGMRQLPQDKTVAFAMKIFDILHRITTGKYANFDAQTPIVADFRIARVSLSSGLIRTGEATVQSAMAAVSGTNAPDQAIIQAVWTRVAEFATEVSLFRIDSLLWQIAEPIFRLRHDRDLAITEICSIVGMYGGDLRQAEEVASQMTAAL